MGPSASSLRLIWLLARLDLRITCLHNKKTSRHHRRQGASSTTPLCSYRPSPTSPFLSLKSKCFTDVLRAQAVMHGSACGLAPNQISVSSFRTTGAMALFNAGVDSVRHLNMRENLVRENGPAGSHTVEVDHVPGKCNFSDNFTKEQKCNATFTASRDTYMCSLADGGCWKVSTPIPNAE